MSIGIPGNVPFMLYLLRKYLKCIYLGEDLRAFNSSKYCVSVENLFIIANYFPTFPVIFTSMKVKRTLSLTRSFFTTVMPTTVMPDIG